MKNIISLVFMIATVSGFSQNEKVINSAGGSAIAPSVHIDWSLGETIVDQKLATSVQLDEGFIQLHIEDLQTLISEWNISHQITILPNPATDFLLIKIDGSNGYQMHIHDSNGRLIHSGFVQNNVELPIQHWQSGSYFIVLKNNTEYGVCPFLKM